MYRYTVVLWLALVDQSEPVAEPYNWERPMPLGEFPESPLLLKRLNVRLCGGTLSSLFFKTEYDMCVDDDSVPSPTRGRSEFFFKPNMTRVWMMVV